MIGALLVGLVAGVIGRSLMPLDAFRHMSGPASWGVSILLGLGGALLGWLIFTLGLGIGDDDIFDWGWDLRRDHRSLDPASDRGLGPAPGVGRPGGDDSASRGVAMRAFDPKRA